MSVDLVLSRGSLAKPVNERALDRLRSEQITMLARWSGVMAFCSVASCIVVVLTFWQTAPRQYLLVLLIALAILHSLAIVGSSVWLRQGSNVASRRIVHVRLAVTAAIATVWATAPFMLMPLATPDGRQLLIYVGSGLVSSSIVLAPLLPAALLFAGINTLGFFLPMPFIDQAVGEQHLILVAMFFLMTVVVSTSQSRDFAKRVLNELTLEEQGDLIGLLLRDFEENASDFLWETDAELRLLRVSDRLAQIMGCDSAALQGACITQWIQNGRPAYTEKHDAEKLLACFAGQLPFRDLEVLASCGEQERWLSISGKPVFDSKGILQGFRGVGSDITAARRSDEQIAYLARYDSLTGLPNRTLFRDALSQACARSEPLALLCLDLDGFKSVNDTLGHGMGDALLVAVAGRLRSCLRDGDVVARLGGDEFAILQAEGDSPAAAALARRLIGRVTEPYQIGGVSTSIGLSIGIALASDSRSSPEDLLKGADLALYHSKAEGRGTWHFFEAAMAARAHERHTLQADLRLAIENGDLFLDFQPIVDLASGEITGAEALVRWLHPTRGRISPADFIPVAEESGLIVALGAWVLRRACQEASKWSGKAGVAVNLSPLQFRDPNLLALVDEVLAETGLSPQRLELEITESVFLDAADHTLACLQALRSRGIRIALDDFGTGYSSLSYLRSFPFDKVKIDQSFIRDLSINKDAISIVRAIIGMAGSLGMRTTGEGVETQSQAKLLQQTGCSQVQGFLFGRPCSPEVIASVMTDGIDVHDRVGQTVE